MSAADSSSYAQLIDMDTDGRRCDVTPIFADPSAFASLTNDLIVMLRGIAFDTVAGIDALGFILGTALAIRARTGFVPLRKAGKLPVTVVSESFVDYSGEEKGLELRRDAIALGSRVLIVDDGSRLASRSARPSG